MKKLAMILCLVLLTTSMSACALFKNKHKQPTYTSKEITPTLYLHGYSGTLNSTKYLIQRATKAHHHDKIYATVDAQGHVKVDRPLSKHDRHPLVIIKLEDNENGDYHTNAQWIKNVLVKLEDQQKFDHYNMVMHSMANMSFSYFMLEHGNDKDLPKFIQFSDHNIAPKKAEHFHIFMGNDNDTLLKEMDNWPTYYPSKLNKDQIKEEMLAH